jgi:POT family proton-dependent oligopeptide transporter
MQASAVAKQGHPKGLYILFFTEMWERFSYYGMRALLVLYLVNHLKFDRKDALAVYGMYTGLVYLTPILGGALADRILGKRKAVIIGGLVMALGHLAMAFEPLLYIALGLLIVGNGFFKPNISTIVGGLYQQGDPRRDGGFTIFYMGINLGAFFSPLVCGSLGESPNWGWHYGFSAAGVGMVFGLLVFLWGQKLLGNVGFAPGNTTQRFSVRDWVDVVLYTVGSTALVVGVTQAWGFVKPTWESLPGGVQVILGLAAVIIPIVLMNRGTHTGDGKVEKLTTVEKQRIAVIAILCFFVIFFWMGFEQAGGTMTLFADKQTDRHLFGWEIPASYFQSINPLLIVLLAPIFSVMWTKLDQSRYALPTAAKMGLGMITLGLGFIVLFIGQGIAEKHGSVGPLWLAGVYALHTLGELCLSPVGLSMVTKLAPARIVSLMMGLWLLSSAVANYLAGTLEGILEKFHIPLYGFLIASSIGAGVLVLLLTPMLKRWTHGAEDVKPVEKADDNMAGVVVKAA